MPFVRSWTLRIFISVFSLLLSIGGAQAELPDNLQQTPIPTFVNQEPIEVSLISKDKNLMPQGKNRFAIVIDHAPGWHTYWKMPGEAGYEPSFSFKLHPELHATQPRLPTPERLTQGGITSFGYTGKTYFPFEVEVPRFVTFGARARISVNVEWLACKESCIPGAKTVSMVLPLSIRSTPNATVSDDFAKMDSLVAPMLEERTVQATRDNDLIRIDIPSLVGKINQTIDFFPAQADTVDFREPGLAVIGKTQTSLYLKAQTKFPSDATGLEGMLVADGGPSKNGWSLETRIALRDGKVTLPTEKVSTPTTTEQPKDFSWRYALLFAFLGGLILNLMPCVLPVLSIKMLDFAQHSQNKQALLKYGLNFTAGIIVTVLSMAVLVLLLKGLGYSLGWGFQLQNPIVVTLLIVLFLCLTLNLWGLFEFTFGSSLLNNRYFQSSKMQHFSSSSFGSGVLAVLISTPCSAPFMGASLGYAITQPSLLTPFIFLALGLGLALPWLVLSIFPVWLKHLPKMGNWVITLKKLLSIPTFLTAIWLTWVLAKQLSFYGLVYAFLGNVLLTFILWLTGRAQYGYQTNKILKVLLSVVMVILFTLSFSETPEKKNFSTHSGWETWSKERVEEAIREGRPVFVDFTAAWCITCLSNEKLVLQSEKVQQAFKDTNTLLLVADWTSHDPLITKELESFKRSGVPLYLIYKNQKVSVLSELLSTDEVLRALKNEK